jgi:membrane peptidoglycan carboxypeptidase
MLVPVILVGGILMAIALGPPFAGLGAGVMKLDARLTAEGADFTRIPRFPTKSTIYASDGKTVLAQVYLDDRELVRLGQISQPAQQAVLSIEDSSFYEHGALDWSSMIRALVENARAGEVIQGGSTITQQLVKNFLENTDSRTFANKFQELAIALRVEQKYTKAQILELYMNQIYLGNGVYGIGTAADFYFHRPASRLSLTQGAMLAGMIRSPEYYNPLTDPQNVWLRRNDVLNRMMALGWMTPQRNAILKAEPLGLAKNVGKTAKAARLPYFVTYMINQIKTNPNGEFDQLGKSEAAREAQLYQGGLKIYTTLNVKWQAAAQYAANQPWAIGVANPNFGQVPDAAVVTLDNDSGAIRVMLSGRNYAHEKDAKDLVTTPHEPGSSFKPYVLAAAFEQGIPPTQTYSTHSPLIVPWWTGNSCHCVQNAEGPGDQGYMDLYKATAYSINVVFAQLAHAVGADNVANVAEQMMGLPQGSLEEVLSLAVGEVPISPLDQASGYQTIANGGVHCVPYTVESIVDPGGRVILQHEPDCYRVLTTDIANQITYLLEGVVQFGTGTSANLGTWPTAGKTGTAQDNKAVWFSGFTQQETTAVWVGFPGNADPLPDYFGSGCLCFGGYIAAPIWRTEMNVVMQGFPPIPFNSPPQVTTTPSPPPSVKVPDVVGQKVADATKTLTDAGFVVTTTSVDNPAPKGTVLTENPAAGSSASPGATIALEVSTGKVPMVKVPNVVGLTRSEATTLLEAAGFVVVVNPADASQHGTVTAQDPPAKTKEPLGTTVTITVGP